MEFAGRVVVVTGAGAGIGAALARAFAAEGARVVVSDRYATATDAVAHEIGGVSVPADVGVEAEVTALVRHAEDIGPIALMASNAGVLARDAGGCRIRARRGLGP